MPGKLDAYNLGERGINLVKSPVHKADGDLVLAQNAQIIPYHAQRAISKRRGMTPINPDDQAAGEIFNLITFRAVDPNPNDTDPPENPDYPPYDPPTGGSAVSLLVEEHTSGYWDYYNGSTFTDETAAATDPFSKSVSGAHVSVYDNPAAGDQGIFYLTSKSASSRALVLLKPNDSVTEKAEITGVSQNTTAFIARDTADPNIFYVAFDAVAKYLYKIDVSGPTVTQLSGYPFSRAPGPGVFFNEALYVGGYNTPNNVTVCQIDKYTPSSGLWSTIKVLDRTANSQPAVRDVCIWKDHVYWTCGSATGTFFSAFDAESKVLKMGTDEVVTAVNPATTGVFTAPLGLSNAMFVFRSHEPSGSGTNFSGCECWVTTDGTSWSLDADLTAVRPGLLNVWAARVFKGEMYVLASTSIQQYLLKRSSAGVWSEVSAAATTIRYLLATADY